jgi:hypothetical protein
VNYRLIAALAASLIVLGAEFVDATPVVFWVSEPVSPGDVVMAYGGDLQTVHSVELGRLPDLSSGIPGGAPAYGADRIEVPALQVSDHSLKFMLPKSFKPGIFTVSYGGRSARVIDAPKVYWCQTTRLLPGLSQNEAAPGSSIQIIGRNFIPASKPAKVRVLLRASGRDIESAVIQIDKYSLIAALPSSLSIGKYQLLVHNGYGGPAGWSDGLPLIIKHPVVWPTTLFNFRVFGAYGDNIHDDSDAFRKVLDAAKLNGGGIVYFPAGTYRLNGWFLIPHRVVLRGEGRNLVWLKWPLVEPKSTSDIIPSVLYTSGEFAIESLSFMVRNAQTIVRDLSWDASVSGRAPLRELRSYVVPPGSEHDVFFRNVDFQLLYYCGRPLRPGLMPQWKLNGFGWADNELIKVIALEGVRNLEISNCRFVGGAQRVLDSNNAHLTGNIFSNEWATLAWTDLGGEYIIFENNDLAGASSWRGNRLPVRHLYCAFNRSSNLVAGEREALTFDVNQVMPSKPHSTWNRGAADAWQGRVLSAMPDSVQLQSSNLLPHAYRGLDLLVLDGRGAGQWRTITDNSEHRFDVTPAWDITPDASSVVLAYQLNGECILYRNHAEDTSVLLEFWGFLSNLTLDGNDVERSQGMWGLSGWFVQWLDNRLNVAVTFHQGVGPGAAAPQEITPEHGAPFGLMGFAIAGQISQLPIAFPYVRACVIKGNHLSYGHRIVMRFGFGPRTVGATIAMDDVVIDRNSIDHTPVGIDVDAAAEGVLLARNQFSEVRRSMLLATPQHTLLLH